MCNTAEARLKNILEAGFAFSGMQRVLERGAKACFCKSLEQIVPNIFVCKTQKDFDKIHSDFCQRVVKKIKQNRRANGAPASYGQIAKTLNVALKLIVYYCHLPNCIESRNISRFLHSAVDNPMMIMFRKKYPDALQPWPANIAAVDKEGYRIFRGLVDRFIREKHRGQITPVQFDDIYWLNLNRD